MGCVFAQADQVEQARYGCCAFRFFGALRQSERHIVGDGAPGEQARFLKADSYAGVEAGHCLLADTHGTCGDAVQACCCTQESGFAASGGADDGDNLAGGCGEGDSAKNFVGSAGHGERLSDVFKAQGDGGGGYGVVAAVFTGGCVSYCTVECHVTSIVPGVSTGGGRIRAGCCDVVEPGLSVALDGLLLQPYGLWRASINPTGAYEFL